MESSVANFTQCLRDDESYLKFYFITNDDGHMPRDVKKAYDVIRDQCPHSEVVEMPESHVLEKRKEELDTELGIFIFNEFKGAAFKHIVKMEKIYVFGPKCVLAVLIDNINIQADVFHFHNLCMKDIFVCFASITDQSLKDRLKKLINYMGGLFSNGLKSSTTHLVTDDVFSKKYYVAGELKFKIMRLEWLEEVWRQQQVLDFKLRADDKYFYQYQLPMFHKLVITSTGISVKEKKNIMKLVEENGGEFCQSFSTSVVKILLMTSKDIDCVKHKTALKFKIHCVDVSWIEDSIAAGYSLPLDKYSIKKETKIKASTPERNTTRMEQFDFENTVLSDISASQCSNITLEGTHAMNVTSNQKDQTKLRPQSAQTAKNAAESSNVERRVSRSVSKQLLNSTASTSNTSTTSTKQDKITKNDTFKKPPPVAQRKEDLKSRVSSVVQQNVDHIIPPAPIFDADKDDNDEEENEDHMPEDASFIQILNGKTVLIYGFTQDNEIIQNMQELEKTGANVVDTYYNKTLDYIITPMVVLKSDFPTMKSHHIVNDEWLAESLIEGRCLDMKFHHHPIFLSHCVKDILKGETFVLSSYEIDHERPYIKVLIKHLGGITIESLKKNDDVILLCPIEEGKKYDAAKNWKMTALRAEWLYHCYKHQTRYDETDFLLKNTNPSKRNIAQKDRVSIILCSQEESPMDLDDDYSIKRRQVPAAVEFALPKRITELRPGLNSPKTPTTPSADAHDGDEEDLLSISNLCADMPTPQRELTKAVLREGQAQNQISPRAQRQKELLKTPGMTQKQVFEESSPMPELPECMRPPPVDYSIRPDSSPDSQWHWKRKLDAVDGRYVPKSDSLRKALLDNIVTPPYHVTRYQFFKRRLPNYNSPDPRCGNDNRSGRQEEASAHCNVGMSQEAAKFLNFNETENQTANKSSYIGPYETNDESVQKEAVEPNNGLDVDYREEEQRNVVCWAPNTQAFIEIRGKNISDKPRKSVLGDISNVLNNEYEPFDGNAVSGEEEVESESPICVDEESEDIPAALNSDGDEIDIEESEEQNKNNLQWTFGVSSGSLADNEIKLQIKECVEALGGRVTESDFNYLVMQKLVKSPKYFSSLASGKFILHPDFIKDSFAQKKFLTDTSPYEYGNPNFRCNIEKINPLTDDLAKGPYICRQAIKNNPLKYQNGLFTGMKLIIACPPQKQEMFKNVVISGGGKVIAHESAALKQEKIDYCLMENEKSLNASVMKTLKTRNVPIKCVKFIYNYLLSSNFIN